MFRLESVSKEYSQREKSVVALQPTTLEVDAGEYIAIVGPSGSGKSTLLTLLGGMIAPTDGKVWFYGQSLYDLNLDERAELRRLKMGFVFQTFNLVPYLTALENVQVPLLLAGHSKSGQRQRGLELLDQVGLADRAHHKPNQLSVGQQQRTALARMLANDPSIILADEPTGNLDPATRNQVLTFLDQFHRSGKTIIMVTHDLQAASRATRTLQMVAGSITGHAAPADKVA
ncbi:MAG: ABC transporter ATP-binding protein [Planctomycetaceae bacterium]